MDKLVYKIKRFWITYGLIGISIFVYILSFIKYGYEMDVNQAIEFGAYNGQLVYYYNEYYRLLVSNFIHFGFLHLLVNCYSLSGIGCFIENIFEKYEFSIIVLASCFSTTTLSYILFLLFGFEAYTLSAGISGVVFGMVGSLFALSLMYKNIFMDIFKSLLPNLIAMLVLSIIIPQISLSGHIFGMLGGFVSTLIILIIKKNKTKIIN